MSRKRDVKPQYSDEVVEKALQDLERDYNLKDYPVELVWYDWYGIKIELTFKSGVDNAMLPEDARDLGQLLTELADAVEEFNETYFEYV